MRERLNKKESLKRKKDIILLYKEGNSPKEICNKLNISSSLVSYYLKNEGLTIPNVPWTYLEEEILKKNYYKTEKNQLLFHLPGRKWRSILAKAYSLGLNRSEEIQQSGLKEKSTPTAKLYNLLEETAEAYYWIGFLLADGWTHDNYLGLSLSAKDKIHIEKYANFIEADSVIVRKETTTNPNALVKKKEYEKVSVVKADKDIVPLIKDKFGFKYKKTKNPPEFSLYKSLPDNLLLSFLIGYLDGDGWCEFNSKKNTARWRTESHHSWKPFFEKFRDELNCRFELNLPKVVLREREIELGRAAMSKATYSGRKLITIFLDHIEKHKLPVLERKWSKIKYK